MAEEPQPNKGMIVGIAIALLMVCTLLIMVIYVVNHPAEGMHHIQQCR